MTRAVSETSGLSAAKRELVERLLQEQQRARSLPADCSPNVNPGALSFAQERLWFLAQIDRGLPAYNFVRAWRVSGPLDLAALAWAFDVLVDRHEVLRTAFPSVDGRPSARILPPAPVQMPVIDLSAIEDEQREPEARRLLIETTERAFDLDTGPLFRAGVVRLNAHDHVVSVVTHHIVFDGWSAGVFERELAVLYNGYSVGQLPTLPSLTLRYADFVRWQRDRFTREDAAVLRSYWKKQLDGIPDFLSVPADRVRPAQPSSNGARHSTILPAHTVESLKSLSRVHGATLFMTLLAVFQTLLHRYTGENDIVVGSPVANRQTAELENLVGFFANMLPLRTRFDEDPTFAELLAQVKHTSLDAYAHQDMPFEKLVDELRPRRSLRHSPIFQVALSLHSVTVPLLSGVTVVPFPISRYTAKFDLTLALVDAPAGMTATYEYRTDLFGAGTISRMAGHFEALLERIERDPRQRISALPLATAVEADTLIVGLNPPPADFPANECVHQLFEAQVRKTPDATAITSGGVRLSYGALNRRANQLANVLVASGLQPGEVVGVCLERSTEFVIALVAVLKAGGAYLPIDPDYPSQRRALMLNDAGARLCVTEQRFVSELPGESVRLITVDAGSATIAQQTADNLPNRTSPDGLAYVIYTSGSTGVPRGVAIPHQAVVCRVINTDYVTLGPSEVVAQASNAAFDAATFEIWGALLNGARLDVIAKAVLLSPRMLQSHIEQQGITTLFLTTALFNRVAEERPGAFGGVKQLLFGGEAADPAAARAILEARAPGTLIHVYGPTEATTFASSYVVTSVGAGDTTIPIGRPICNTRIYILDRHLNPSPVNVTGEIYIGGPGVALGYLNESLLTAEKFIRDPFVAGTRSRLYRSGDLARYRADGNIEFVGRADDQVKLRGFRIEPGEIEATLREHPRVRWASVMIRADARGDKQLVAYLTGDRIEDPRSVEIRGFLARKLPDYMVPSAFVWLESVPLTPGGKVDRAALPTPVQPHLAQARMFAPAVNALEQKLTTIWQQVLGTSPIGLHDNFFELGGHSLLAVVLVARIERICGTALTPAVLFEAPTVAQLADILRSTAPVSSPLVPIQPTGTLPPLFCVHGLGGNVLGYADLARNLGREQPVYGLQSVGLDADRAPHTSLEEMAQCYVTEIRNLQPQGPYYLCGLSMGGTIAHEMARQLHEQGQRIGMLAMFDTTRPGSSRVLPPRLRFVNAARRARYHAQQLLDPGRRAYLARTIKTVRRRLRERIWDLMYLPYWASGAALPRLLHRVHLANRAAVKSYTPKPYAGNITLFRARERSIRLHCAPEHGWSGYAAGGIQVFDVAGDHVSLIREPAVALVAGQLRRCLEDARRRMNEEDA
jgi:amino acid adenylation domain-containing protein